jgi:hypothetical protein
VPNSKPTPKPTSKQSSMPNSKPTSKQSSVPTSKTTKKAFIFDDNNNDVESINLQVNNSNLGSTYYIPSQSYSELTKENSLFLINGIYFQNIYTSFNKSIDDEQNILFKELGPRQISESEYEKILYPQYFYRTKLFTNEEKIKYFTIYEDETVKKIDTQLPKTATLKKENVTKIAETATQYIKETINTIEISRPKPSKSTIISSYDKYYKENKFKSKYLKYKNKYLELKNKLNL